ncbi:MAG: endonuclease III, partial [Planctomycetes bacterium]|nr:endonuclease III [Planctomycetota bacterium]
LKWLNQTVGEYSLDVAIEKLGVDASMEALTGLKGIGVKTIGVTLIEALGVDLCPVDTHVHRIINRWGIVDTKSNRDKTFALLKPLIPEGRAYSLHHNLLTFGRTVCTAKSPKCGECFLRKLCPSAE